MSKLLGRSQVFAAQTAQQIQEPLTFLGAETGEPAF
jgi:hypothetical protein